jgi:Fe-S-cluster containining protein
MQPVDFDKAAAEILRQVENYQAQIAKLPAGRERAKVAIKALQELIEREKKQHLKAFEAKVQCKAGCAGCCHQQVEVSGDEGALLASLVDNGLKIDMERLERQANTDFTDLEWWRQSQRDKACLFLDEKNQCRIYSMRPMACRKYFVFTPPEQCAEVSPTGSITVGVYTIPDAEIFATAIMDYVRGEAPMAKAIWKNLKARKHE